MTTWNWKPEIASIFWNNLRDSFDIPIGFGNWLKPLVDLCYILYVYDCEHGDGAGLVSHRSNSDHNRSNNIKYFNLIYFLPVITEVIYCFQYRIWYYQTIKNLFFSWNIKHLIKLLYNIWRTKVIKWQQKSHYIVWNYNELKRVIFRPL